MPSCKQTLRILISRDGYFFQLLDVIIAVIDTFFSKEILLRTTYAHENNTTRTQIEPIMIPSGTLWYLWEWVKNRKTGCLTSFMGLCQYPGPVSSFAFYFQSIFEWFMLHFYKNLSVGPSPTDAVFLNLGSFDVYLIPYFLFHKTLHQKISSWK